MPVIRVRQSEKKGDWFITANGQSIHHYSTKQEAIDAAKDFGKEWGFEVMIDGINGQIYRHSEAIESAKEARIRSAIREVSNLPNSFSSSRPNRRGIASGSSASVAIKQPRVGSHSDHDQGSKTYGRRKG